MHHRATLAVAAGLPFALAAAPSLAQSTTVTVRLEHDDADSIINVGETVAWSLSIEFEGFADGSTASSLNADILADNALGTSSDFAYTASFVDAPAGFNGGTNGGNSSGAGIDLVNFTNSLFIEDCCFGSTPATRSNPLVVGAFDFTATARGTLRYTIVQSLTTLSFLSIDQSLFQTDEFDAEDVNFQIDTLTIVPSPASVIPFATLVLASRRRR